MSTSQLALAPAQQSVPSGAAGLLFQALGNLRFGHLRVVCPKGTPIDFAGAQPGPRATLIVHDWSVFSDIIARGDIGFAEAYLEQKWDTDDLPGLIALAVRNEAVLEAALFGRWLSMLAYRLRHRLRTNTRSGSRRNIHAHYDLGNDFYRLWLDESMSYSAALFDNDPARGLPLAQAAKYERVLEQFGARAGEHILEIGCGWGGFAEAAARRGCRVTGITVSRAQLEYARERIAAAGLSHLVNLELRDYRDLSGVFDHVVSIEMLEAVGERYWKTYFRTLRAALRPGGRAVLQVITIADDRFERYRRGTDFIQQYIFPGGMLPSPRKLTELAAGAAFEIADRYAFGADYAETLRRWRASVGAREDAIRALGFDERFLRLWRFYLAYCEAGFNARTTDVEQITLVRR